MVWNGFWFQWRRGKEGCATSQLRSTTSTIQLSYAGVRTRKKNKSIRAICSLLVVVPRRRCRSTYVVCCSRPSSEEEEEKKGRALSLPPLSLLLLLLPFSIC